MKERLVTLVLAVGAFVLFCALFLPRSDPDAETMVLPVSIEGRDAGYQAAWRWLQSQDVPVLSWRDRYGSLDRQPLQPTGNLMISTLPHKVPAREDESRALEAWLGQGNTLLVMAALNDTPPWALGASLDFLNTIARLSGLRLRPLRGNAAEETGTVQSVREVVRQLLEPGRATIAPRGAHALFDGVQSVGTRSEYPASRWIAQRTGLLALELADRTDRVEGRMEAEPAIWLRPLGQGQVIVVTFASPFSNVVIGEQDNARLLANIVAWSLTDGGTVLFDDAHQGVVNYYDAKAFFADPRLHRTLLWLGLLWLLFVLGWQRLRPHTDSWQPADVTRFIRVTGDFLAGNIATDRTARRLIENFFNTIRRRLALPQDGEPIWDWLAAQASVPPAQLQTLRQLHARAQAGQRIDLIKLQNCLTNLTGKLT